MAGFISKEKLSDKVCKYLQQKILSGEYKDGERLVETKIAKSLGISQSPVREALRELEIMGLVEIKPYSGCTVRTIDEKRMKQIFTLRTMLEVFAAQEGLPNLREEDLSTMEASLQRMQDAVREGDVFALSEWDVDFHHTVVKAADNFILERMWSLIGASQWTNVTMSVHEDLSYFPGSHDKLLEYARNKDIPNFCSELTNHFTAAAKVISGHTFSEKDSKSISDK